MTLVPCLLAMLLGGLGAGDTAPRAGQDAAPVVEVSLERVAALPGQDLTVPVAVAGSATGEVAEIRFVVTFPGVLTFETVTPAYAFRELGGSLAGTRVGGEARRVEVKVRSATAPLLPGAVGYLVFRVAPDAPLGPLAVAAENLHVTDRDGEAISPGRVHVEGLALMDPKDAVVPPCFFYMH